jgi:two-component system cell cycle sensor histidine kinase/response regulator CckA
MSQPQEPNENTTYKEGTLSQRPAELKTGSDEQEQIKARLQLSESTLQTIFRAAPIGIGLVTNRVLGWVNDRLCTMLGRERDELEGKNARIVYPSDEEYERVGRIKHPIVLERGTGSIETKFVHKDGHILDVLLSSSAMVPADISSGLIFTVLDLTERKSAEAERDRLFNLSMDLLCIAGLDGYFKQVNPSWERVLGWSPEELMSRPWLEFVHPEDRSRTQMAGEELKKGVSVIAFINRCRCRDENYRWLSWNILPLPKEGLAFAIARDITDKKIADDALKRSQRELSANNRIVTAFLTSPDEDVYEAVFRVVLDVLVSPCGFFGYINDRGELVCPAIISYTGDGRLPADRAVLSPAAWSGVWRQAIETRQTLSRNGPALPEGLQAGQHTLATPILYQGAAIGIFCVADKDGGYNKEEIYLLETIASQVAPVLHARLQAITHEQERQRVEQERAELEEHIRHTQKMEAIGQLAGGIAHDFNNLLQVISGNIEIIKNDIPKTPSVQETLAEIVKASNRATSLVRQLLTFSRRVPMQFQNLNLNDVIGNLLKMLHRILGEDIDLDIQGEADLRYVFADPGQVEQILINLCVNARDAMPNGGSIRIKTSNVFLDEAFCRTQPDAHAGDYVCTSVSDTGVGIPLEAQAHIFEPFFTTKDIGEGTGLGLATVYAISRRHNGFIGMASEPGKGTTMSLYLPVATTTESAPEQEKSDVSEEAGGGSETILLAEDDPQVRELAKKILERAGYRIHIARDGEEAIRVFRMYAGEIDLAILDVIMPKHNGPAVYKAITAERPELPVFFCSGYSYSELEARQLPYKDIRIIQKPYSRNTLLHAIRRALKKD